MLEGSVQRDQNRVRVNAQLIDAETGAHIWADRFEADMADLFKLQDQVVAQLANALRYELGMAEAAKGARAQNPDAIDLAMRGWAVMPPHSMPSKDEVEAATPLFKQALKIESGSKEPNRNKVGKLTQKQLEDIAKVKMPDINANDMTAAKKIVAGTARSMGVEVEA